MAEEPTNETGNLTVDDPADSHEAEDVDVSPEVEEARSKGWVSEEEWNGNPEDWVDAGEFLRRAPLFKQISNMRSEMKKLREAVTWQQSHYEQMLKRQKEQMITKLKQERMEALQESDLERVTQIEADLEKAQQTPVPQNPAVNTNVPPEFQAWMDDNYWYTADPKLRLEADTYGSLIGEQINRGQRPQMAYSDILKEVTNYIRKEYPEKFGKPRSTPKVESGNDQPKQSTARSRKGKTFSDIPEEHRTMAKTIMRSTGMTKDEYAKSYFGEE